MQAQKYSMTAEEAKLFQDYIKTVPYTIYTYFNYKQCQDLGYLDIQNAGYLGLVYAIKTYDESRGNSFLSWAIKNIRYSIIRYIKAQKRTTQCLSIESIRDAELGLSNGCGCTRLWKVDYLTPHIERLDNKKLVEKINQTAKEILNDRMYDIYEKHFLNELTAKEIAQELECTRAYVYGTIDKIKYKIQKELKEQGLLE